MSVTYRQADSRWANKPYPNSRYKFANNGCGPTACASIIVNNPKYEYVTPEHTRQYMLKHGYAVAGNGTKWDGIKNCLKNYGFTVSYYVGENSKGNIFSKLKGGAWAVFLMGATPRSHKPCWTTGGHYIAISGIKVVNGITYLYVRDPGRRHNDGWFKWSQFSGYFRRAWVATLPDTPKPKEKTVYKGKLPTVTVYKGNCTTYRAKLVQAYINWYYQKVVLTVDGHFGPKTDARVKALQEAWGLKQTGRVDSAWNKKARAEKR